MKDFLEDFDPIQWWLLILLPILIGIRSQIYDPKAIGGSGHGGSPKL